MGEKEQATEEELRNLKETYTDQLRVITGVGEYSHVVNFQPKGTNVNIKLQLTAKYPGESPNIMVRSSTLSPNEQTDLIDELNLVAKNKIGSSSLTSIVDEVLNWVETTDASIKEEGTPKKTKKKQSKQKKREKEHQSDGSDDEGKKPSMKTAIDVINRIQWDSSLQSDDFLVGYIDRFCGIQEKYFSAFSWEDIASVDYNVLAVPKHRIQYFKYKDVVVWDKVKRFDYVFGSNNSGKTITDVIADYEAELVKSISGNKSQGDAVASGGELVSDDESDSDSDDGINVVCTNAAFDASKFDDDNDDDDDIMDTNIMMKKEESNWQNKLRPNHFIALRITDASIKNNITEVQKHIKKYQPLYKGCCIPEGAMHITLCMLGLDTTEQIANAVQALQKAKSELKSMVPKKNFIELDGVSNFYDRVVYAKANASDQFFEFVEHLKLCLSENGVAIRDGYDFVPHCTIMKVSRPVARQMGKTRIDPLLYQSFHDKYFGKQTIDRIHLCSICDSRQSDGFYLSATDVDLS